MAALSAYPALAELTGKDFLSSADITPEQTSLLLELAAALKAGRLQPRQGLGEGLGVFEAVEIAQLRQHHRQAAAAAGHGRQRRQALQQGGGS